MTKNKQTITNTFEIDGKTYTRSTSDDYRTLPHRHIDTIRDNVPGIENKKDIMKSLENAHYAYARGWYQETLAHINEIVRREPALEPYLFYYATLCNRVLAVPLEAEELKFDKKVHKQRAKPHWWKKYVGTGRPAKIRCKWCGRYVDYINPNTPTFGFSAHANSCEKCGHMYPTPSWMWDSPDGRAYSYYRLSFGPQKGDDGRQFYRDFLSDYEPNPTVEKSVLFKQ